MPFLYQHDLGKNRHQTKTTIIRQHQISFTRRRSQCDAITKTTDLHSFKDDGFLNTSTFNFSQLSFSAGVPPVVKTKIGIHARTELSFIFFIIPIPSNSGRLRSTTIKHSESPPLLSMKLKKSLPLLNPQIEKAGNL